MGANCMYSNLKMILLMISFVSSSVYGDELAFMPPTEHFAKCFSKLTDYPVDVKSALYTQVKNNEITAAAACMSVFDKAMFDKSTRRLKNTNDIIAKGILQNFHRFHLSWLTMPLGSNVEKASFSLIDNDEPALYITDTLFMNRPFKYVVTANESLQGVRDTNTPENYVIDTLNLKDIVVLIGPMKPRTEEPDSLKNYQILPGPRVDVGELKGIRTSPSRVYNLPVNFASPTPLVESQLASRRLEATTYDMSHHPGGGVLGSAVFAINNS